MKDYKIVIDAGHGGTDPGASGNGIIEKDLTLEISNYMYNKLRDLGVPVKIIRSTDETLTPTQRVNRVLDAYGNSSDVIVVSNHINAGGGEGAEVIYALRNTATLPNLILQELEDEGQIIRKAYQRRLPSDTSKDYYFMQRNTGNTQSITVEYGFLDNINDANKLKNNYIDYTDAVIRALLEYIGYSGGENTYTVKSGDSLWSIAKKFNVSVQELKDINNLTGNLLNIGQVLVIPQEEEEISGNTSLSMAAAGYIGMAIMGYCFSGNVTALGACYILTSLGTGSMFVNQTVMLADCVDYGEYKTGKRNQSLTFSMKGFLQKMAYTIQAIIMYATFTVTGYDGEALVQTAQAKSAISFLMFIVPPVMMIASLIIFSKKYRIHGEFKQEVLRSVSEAE